MRKLLLAALAVAVAAAGLSALALGNAGEAKTSWDLKVKPNKVKKAGAVEAVIEPAKVDDQGTADRSDDVYTHATKNTLVFTKGSSIDTSALKRCKATASEVGSGAKECPKGSKVGDGSAIAVNGGTKIGDGSRVQGGEDTASTVVAYNQKKTLLLVVTVCGKGTGPGTGKDCVRVTDIVLEGTWSKTATKPTLTVPTPPGLISLGIVIRKFELDTLKKTKTVKQNGKEVLKSFLFTPETCGGKWTSQAKVQYADGSSQTIKDTQKCKKP